MKRSVAWEITGGGAPVRLENALIDLEKSLEDWVEADVSIAADDVLVIGRQTISIYNTALDLLGIDGQGDTVVIELKRHQTLRETVAQGIEYASWIAKLGREDILALAAQRFGSEEAFQREFESTFGVPLPDEINGRQRVLLVAPEISDATAGVIEYLAETYRMPINAVSFDVFALDGRRLLVRQAVLEDKPALAPPGSKTRSKRTLEEFLELAEQNEVADLVQAVLELRDIAPSIETFIQSFALRAKRPDKKLRAAFSVYPTAETNQRTISLNLSQDNLEMLYGRSASEVSAFLDSLREIAEEESQPWAGWRKFKLSRLDQAEEFSRRFRAFGRGDTLVVPTTLTE